MRGLAPEVTSGTSFLPGPSPSAAGDAKRKTSLGPTGSAILRISGVTGMARSVETTRRPSA
jgi:hypothetical protein